MGGGGLLRVKRSLELKQWNGLTFLGLGSEYMDDTNTAENGCSHI